jgi:hypothetical protein
MQLSITISSLEVYYSLGIFSQRMMYSHGPNTRAIVHVPMQVFFKTTKLLVTCIITFICIINLVRYLTL